MTEQASPESIFERVLQCTGQDERTICLEQACGGNEELRREVESLLAAHQAAGSFLEPLVTWQEILRMEASSGIYCLAFSPDGRRLAGGGLAADGTVKLWDAKTGKLMHRIDEGIEGRVAFSPDFRLLAAADRSGRIGVWNTQEAIARNEDIREERIGQQREHTEGGR